jgi:hypothetical protein
MTDHSGQPVRAFPVGGRKERGLIIGEGADRDELQARGRWISAAAGDTADLEVQR